MGSNVNMEEFDLMKDSKYRVYVSAVDKALKSFEYTSEWADLISALGKLNKVLVGNMKFPVIPRRIKISKRLAQCMHPALPSGVHLKALETYDIIFKCMGTNRLSHELFIYSAGLFPLLGNAAMNVRPNLLTVYETHFVPLGERLRPALSGFLSGVLPGLEEGSDHFDRTNLLLEKVCEGVGPEHFYACLWDCIASNSGIRLPAILFILAHFNRKLSMAEQSFIMGTKINIMVDSLCAAVQDHSVLVQRSALDFLLIGFPVHNSQLNQNDMVKILTASLKTILRRDMSLNRRLFAWLLGTEVNTSILKKTADRAAAEVSAEYFDKFSKNMLIEAIRENLRNIYSENPQDIRPYRILISLLDKPDIGPVILDDILFEVFRTFYNACSDLSSKNTKSSDVIKSVNLLFSTLEPHYVWVHCAYLFEKACTSPVRGQNLNRQQAVKEVGNGIPDLQEICALTEFLLETVSLDAFIDTPSENLPNLFYSIIENLSNRVEHLFSLEILKGLQLSSKVLSKVQPVVSLGITDKSENKELKSKLPNSNTKHSSATSSNLSTVPLEKSQSDSKLNQQEIESISFVDRSPSPRRRANSSGPTKKNDKKGKKKSSKSNSKLTEAHSIQSENNENPNPLSAELKNSHKNKSMEDIRTDIDDLNRSLDLDLSKNVSMDSTVSLNKDPSPAQKAQHSMLEKCLKLYKQFYVELIEKRILEKEKSINKLYESLKTSSLKDNLKQRSRQLENLLNSKLSLNVQDVETNETKITAQKISNIPRLYLESINEDEWDEVLKIASLLLVELSTFPSYFLSGDNLLTEDKPGVEADLPDWLKILVVCACWFSKQPSLQLTSIGTLLDLISLSKIHTDTPAHANGGEGVTTVVIVPLMKSWHVSYLTNCTSIFQILGNSLWNHLGESPVKYKIRCVELLHELHHVLDESCDAVEDIIGGALMCESMEKRIESSNRFASLWHLGREMDNNTKLRSNLRSFDKSLLKILDNLQLADNLPLKLQAQSWLLHSLVRNDISRLINPILMMLLDPSTCRMSVLHVSIQHSNIVLTKRDTIQEPIDNTSDDTEGAANIYAISSVDGNVIYHVSNGLNKNKIWCREPATKTINPVKVKRIFAVTTLTSGDKGNRYVTERNQVMKELEVPPSISGNRKISVFVNPLSISGSNYNLNDSSTEEEMQTAANERSSSNPEILNNSKKLSRSDFNKGSTSSLDDSISDSPSLPIKFKDTLEESKKCNGDLGSLSLDSINNSLELNNTEANIKQSNKITKDRLNIPGSSREIAGTLIKGKYYSTNEFNANYDNLTENGNFESTSEIPSWTMGDEEGELETSTAAEEYFSNSSSISIVEEVLKEVIDKVIELCEPIDQSRNTIESTQIEDSIRRNTGVGVHNLHSHMLLYCGVYDSSRTSYALRILKYELLANPRMFLCSAATTGIANNSRSSTLLNLLARHRKSIFGRNFHGNIANTEFIATYRSSMYLEVIISVCLYFARSYYPNLGQMRLTQEEISGNRQVQLASTELLTLIFSELIPLARESGKGFSCYVVDLLTKCKVQKVVLHCLISSVLTIKSAQKDNNDIHTFTEEIALFNDPIMDNDISKCKYRASNHTEAFQIQLLRLLLALMILEHQCSPTKNEDLNLVLQTSPEAHNLSSGALKYIPGVSIPQQPMFLTSILCALKLDHMRHLHQYWTTLVTSSLPFLGPSFTQILKSILRQLCCNIEKLASYYLHFQSVDQSKINQADIIECCLPPDYTVTQLEALTFLMHYCLLDTSQQMNSSLFQFSSSSSHTGITGVKPLQMINNLVHIFMSNPLLAELSVPKDKTVNERFATARKMALNHLPRIISSLSVLWESVLINQNEEPTACVLGCPRVVKHQLLELLSPISFHHGVNFLAAIAVAWHERRPPNNNNLKKVSPEANSNQQVIVDLISAIRVMPIDTLVQTVHNIIKSPPTLSVVRQDFSLEVAVLELLYTYMKNHSSQSLVESWTSLHGLLKDGLSLTAPAQFLLLAILNEYVQKCPSMQEKKDIRDLQDVTAKLVESCSNIAGACLEQTTWLRRNLAVREDVFEVTETPEGKEGKAITPGTPPNAAYSVQAQIVLAEILAPLLDVTYGSQEKERVATILTNLMYNVTPYLKYHTTKNISSFTACSQLLSSLSGYQYTRKAWRKDVLDLLLDPAFFQMTHACLPYWRTIIDNLMTHDNTTFRDLLTKISIAQSSSISIFSSKEQEYEQRAQLLKRLAFVILCSEMDQYQKFMPEIQERLADSLRLPQVIPSIQTQVFLCFRVLLLRVSPQHATSLWPVIVSELVQVFLHTEQELSPDSDDFNNGYPHGHPHWLQLQLAAAKLLDLALLLPAHRLPQFQMYRWAFVGDATYSTTDINQLCSDFIPHITRIAKLMDNKFNKHGVSPSSLPVGELLLTASNIRSLQDIHHFFTALSKRSENSQVQLNISQLESVIEQDFLEKLPEASPR